MTKKPVIETCGNYYNCCNCGGNNCGCAYCFSCNACEACKDDDINEDEHCVFVIAKRQEEELRNAKKKEKENGSGT